MFWHTIREGQGNLHILGSNLHNYSHISTFQKFCSERYSHLTEPLFEIVCKIRKKSITPFVNHKMIIFLTVWLCMCWYGCNCEGSVLKCVGCIPPLYTHTWWVLINYSMINHWMNSHLSRIMKIMRNIGIENKKKIW